MQKIEENQLGFNYLNYSNNSANQKLNNEFSDVNLKDMQQDNYWLTSVVKAYTTSLTEDKLKN